MASYLPVPIVAVHTTSIAYCFGEGLLSSFSGPAPTVQTDTVLGRIIQLGGSGFDDSFLHIDIPAGVTGLTFGFFLYQVGDSDFTPLENIQFRDSGGNIRFNVRVGTGGGLTFERGATQVAAATTPIPGGLLNGANAVFFEGSIEFHDTTGRLAWRVNGNDLEIDEDDIDTLDGAGPISRMTFLHNSSNSNKNMRISGYVRARDGTDNFWGRGMYRFLPYTADVGVQFTPTGAGSNNNDRISETDPDGDTTRVSSSTDGHKDTYGPPDASAVTGAVPCLWNYQGSKQDGSALLHSVVTPDGEAEDVEANGRLIPFAAYGGIATAYETIPGTATPWSGASISALDAIGFELEIP